MTTTAAVRARLGALLATELGVDPADVRGAASLSRDLALDSLAVVELVMVVEDAFEVGLPDRDLADLDTVDALAAAVARRLDQRSGWC